MKWWVRRRVHVSWLITAVAAGALVGLLLAGFAGWRMDDWLGWLTVAFVLTVIALWRQRVWVIPLVIIAGMIIGVVRGGGTQSELTVYQQLIGKSATITGKILEDPDTGKDGQLVLRIGDIQIDNTPLPGKLWVTTSNTAQLQRSDHIQIHGKFGSGFGNFAATIYRATLINASRPQPGDIGLAVRDWFADRVRQTIPEPQASLGLGYLLGQKRALPDELITTLQIVGLTHIVVASGYNLTILVRLTRRLFARVSKYLAVLSGGALIIGFIAITGLSPSMSRAGLVTGLSLAAWYYGRNFHPLVLLTIAASVTALIEPGYIWGDLGWLLSFLAFAGVLLLAPLLVRYFFDDEKPGFIRQVIIETTAAQLLTWPVIIASFGSFSLLSLPANLLVVPLVPLAMLLVFVAGLPLIGGFFGWLATGLLSYMSWIAHVLASESWAVIEYTPPLLAILAYYAILVGFCVYLWRVTHYNFRAASVVE